MTLASYFWARRAPESTLLSDERHIVRTFGSSKLQHQETTDSLTIANTWALPGSLLPARPRR